MYRCGGLSGRPRRTVCGHASQRLFGRGRGRVNGLAVLKAFGNGQIQLSFRHWWAGHYHWIAVGFLGFTEVGGVVLSDFKVFAFLADFVATVITIVPF